MRWGPRPRPGRVLAAAIVFIVLGAGHSAKGEAPYVLYHHVFGEWSVTCWEGLLTKARSCSLGAPVPALDETVRRSVVQIEESGDGALKLSVVVRGEPTRRMDVVLRVDGADRHSGRTDDAGRAIWTGADAQSIVAGLREGKSLSLRIRDTGTPRDEVFALAGFAAALADYRARGAAFAAQPAR
ncbi:MAG: hypothetical protein QF902_07265 [Rhodospirillales bacterium]|nr:hypothetical protein [Rhodospirillales bacterium]